MAFSRLIPVLHGRRWWDVFDYPSSIQDQHFGTGLLDCDLHPPTTFRGVLLRPRTQASIQSSGQSEVKNEKDKFQVMLNVTHFKKEEIKVKVVGDYIIIHAKHEEKSDAHGFISREFTRRYMLPEGTEVEGIKSTMSGDGVLIIEVPKKVIEVTPANERLIPITTAVTAAEETPKE